MAWPPNGTGCFYLNMCFYLKTPYRPDIVDWFTLEANNVRAHAWTMLTWHMYFLSKAHPNFLALGSSEEFFSSTHGTILNRKSQTRSTKTWHPTDHMKNTWFDVWEGKGGGRVSPWSCLADIVCSRRHIFFATPCLSENDSKSAKSIDRVITNQL